MNIDPKKETQKIINFIKMTLKDQGFKKVVLGLSGGIDSTVVLYLLKTFLDPKNITIAHLYYFDSKINELNDLLIDIPQSNIKNISIKKTADELKKSLGIGANDRLRLGNIMARVRMIMLYDLAKKENALVMGTEDKSELLLGYFTRFGDEASDIEPIQHLYKTQIYQLAQYLNVPKNFRNQKPSPGLWEKHTAEEELGFTYNEADRVLDLFFEKKVLLKKIDKKQFPNAEKIIDLALKNSFKHRTPYTP